MVNGKRFWRFMECVAPLYVIAFVLFASCQIVWRMM